MSAVFSYHLLSFLRALAALRVFIVILIEIGSVAFEELVAALLVSFVLFALLVLVILIDYIFSQNF